MIFKKIKLHNFGIYRGDHELQLDKITNKNITLVGGMNGRGKTTILDAIFIAFYGKRALPLIQDEVKNYNNLMARFINKSATDQWTSVSVTIDLEDDGPTVLTIQRRWTQHKGKVIEELSVVKDGLEDKYLSDNWNYYVEEIIPFGISRFFFFDNEQIAKIADDEAFNEIKDSIKAVMGVTNIDKLLVDVQAVMKEKQAKLTAESNDTTLDELKAVETDIMELEQKLATIRMERAGIVPRLEKTTADLEALEQRFWRSGGNLGLKREEIEKEKARLVAEEEAIKQKQLALAVSPATPLALCRNLVQQTYNAAKEAEGLKYAHYSRPLVEEIVDRITGKIEAMDIDAVTKLKLQLILAEELSHYPAEAVEGDESVLNPASILLLEKLIDSGFFDIITQRNALIQQMDENESALLQIDAHLSSNAEKSNAADLLSKIRGLDRVRDNFRYEIDRLDKLFDSIHVQLEALNSKRIKLIKKIADIENSGDDDERILSYAAKTISVMETFKLRLQESKVKELEANITECFKFLAQKEAMITSVEVDPVSLDIILRDYNGGILLKSQLSAGEKQMFAIAIIWGLALSSGYKLPVVIDTPMARLDSSHRYNFINRYLPNASSQVMVLSTDEEVNGRYLEQLREHIGTYYTLKYDEVDKSTSILPGYFGEDYV
jgi:DNA sulfur modification protein DndD